MRQSLKKTLTQHSSPKQLSISHPSDHKSHMHLFSQYRNSTVPTKNSSYQGRFHYSRLLNRDIENQPSKLGLQNIPTASLHWGKIPTPTCVLDMTQNKLMVRFQQFRSFREYRVPLYCNCFLIHFDPDQQHLIGEVPVVYWLSSQEMDTATRVQIMDETDCISDSTNTLGKGMNPIILPPAIGKQQG